MRWIAMMLVGILVGCGSQTGEEKDEGAGEAAFAAAQKVVDGVAAKHAELLRLTIHAVPAGTSECTQIASTMAARRGKPSDPEDLKAMETGEEIVMEESGAIDVTVPILMKDGKPTAIAGVTVKAEEGGDREALLAQARAIAKELEAAVQAAGKPIW